MSIEKSWVNNFIYTIKWLIDDLCQNENGHWGHWDQSSLKIFSYLLKYSQIWTKDNA